MLAKSNTINEPKSHADMRHLEIMLCFIIHYYHHYYAAPLAEGLRREMERSRGEVDQPSVVAKMPLNPAEHPTELV